MAAPPVLEVQFLQVMDKLTEMRLFEMELVTPLARL
jgi:hypothetical protein